MDSMFPLSTGENVKIIHFCANVRKIVPRDINPQSQPEISNIAYNLVIVPRVSDVGKFLTCSGNVVLLL